MIRKAIGCFIVLFVIVFLLATMAYASNLETVAVALSVCIMVIVLLWLGVYLIVD